MAEDDGFLEDMSHQEQQEFLYDVIGFLEGESRDEHAHQLFWDAMYNDDLTINERIDKYDELGEYIYETYGLFVDDLWDWEDFKEWYALQ